MSIVGTLEAQNINDAFQNFWWKIRGDGIKESSRNGDVLVMPGPFTTLYRNPAQKVLFNPVRDANGVFHLMEAIWMLAGRDDVRFLLPFNARYAEYGEPDGHVHGAYGRRWASFFGVDQISEIVRMLKKNPNSRQCVMEMWSAQDDLTEYPLKDRPCNTHIYFDCRGGKLNMTVCCRSNDMLWGGYGANIVHFACLQEVMATAIGVPLGHYAQMSNNCHVYTDVPQVKQLLASPPMESYDFYSNILNAKIIPMMGKDEIIEDFLYKCRMFCEGDQVTGNYFLDKVADPLRTAYLRRKEGLSYDLSTIADCDWKLAFSQWCDRRAK